MVTITLAAVGDISFARTTESAFRKFGGEHLFRDVADDLGKADIRFGNQESVMIPHDFPLTRASGRPLQSSDAVMAALRPLKFDVLNMATNHVLDCGWRGLLHTAECIRAVGAQAIGAGINQADARALRVVERKGVKVGFLGYQQPGTWTLEGGGGRVAYLRVEDIIQDIRDNQSRVDVLVVSLHVGVEFPEGPSPRRQRLCREIAEAGADLVLCHHPHVPQGVERWGDALIHYSLGNFLFDVGHHQFRATPNTARSHIFYVDIEDGRIVRWRRRYFRIEPEYGCPRRIPDQELAEEDGYYRHLDALVQEPETLKQMWRQYSLKRLSRYLGEVRKNPSMPAEEFLRVHLKDVFREVLRDVFVELYDMAHEGYLENAFHDFEYKRPYAPYEEGNP